MSDQLQVKSNLFSTRDPVVFVPRTAEIHCTSQTDRQQDRKVVNGIGGEMSTLARANIALSRWLQNEARFHDPTF